MKYQLIVLTIINFAFAISICTADNQIGNDHSSSAQNGPRIVISPSTSVVHIDVNGPSKVFTCKTAGDKPGMFSQLKWTGPNSLDNYDELRRRHAVNEEIPQSNIWDLELLKPTVDDSGTYYCRGTYQGSDVHSASVTIKVVNSIRLDNCHDRQFLIQGMTNQKITCRITGDSPRVTLWKGETLIDQMNVRYKWDNDDGLVINGEVNVSDAGVYTIRVTNEMTGDRKVQKINVQVHTKPEILPYTGPADQAEFYGIEGERAELKCDVRGNPRPLIFWLDPRLKNLTSEAGYHVNPESGSVIIDRVRRFDDHGQFQCFATNTVTTVSRQVSFAVYTKPQIHNFDNKTVDEGSEVTFECRASGEPTPNFLIRRYGINQQAYKLGDGFVRDLHTDAEGGGSNVFVHRLTIVANRSHFGEHFCNATNKAGTADRVGKLFVNYKPDLSLTPSEQYVKLGHKYSITCHIRAYPEPTITWLSDNTQVLNVKSNTKTSPDGQTHIVTMSPPEYQQGSYNRYICRAENKMGITEQSIIPRYTTRPGIVVATMIDRSPTTVKLLLEVPNDGGDRIKQFVYKADGITLDMHNPIYNFREDHQNETILEASPNLKATYTIRNLLPYYTYRLLIKAVNDVGQGDPSEIRIETMRPTRPDAPLIIKPSIQSFSQSVAAGVPSEYSNGYLLKWSPPDLDNGDPIKKFIIKYRKVDMDSLDMPIEDGEVREVEQMNERPMHARIGPLETNQRYKIQLQARNNYGDSEASYIIVNTLSDRPQMSEFQSVETLAWIADASTETVMILLVVAIIGLILVDFIFHYFWQVGVTYLLRSWCCPRKTNSVISDKGYP